jgi:hypothetical protein
MLLNTASSVISLARNLEEESALFYEGLAKQYPASAELFTGFAKENRKFIKQFEAAYYGVITDALEGCYAFNLDPDKYQLNTKLDAKAAIAAAASKALDTEDNLIRFYTDAAEQSKPLMADVPRTFTLIAKKRTERVEQIKGLK